MQETPGSRRKREDLRPRGDESRAMSSEPAAAERKWAPVALKLSMALGALGPQEPGLGRPPRNAGVRLQNAFRSWSHLPPPG